MEIHSGVYSIYGAQFHAARAIARISCKQFAHFGNQLSDPEGKVVYVSNTPRSGTTLFMTMIQVSDKVVSLSEPDIFVHLSIIKRAGKVEANLLEKLVSASFRHMCRDLKADERLELGKFWCVWETMKFEV